MSSDVVFISLGYACLVKGALKDLNLTIPERLPFDYISSTVEYVIDSFKQDFNQWYISSNFFSPAVHKGNGFMYIRPKGYNVSYPHDLTCSDYAIDINPKDYYDSDGYYGDIPIKNESINMFIENYKRRIQRMKNLINSNKKIIFIRYAIVDTIEQAIELFNILKSYCGNKKFILYYVLDYNSLKWYDLNQELNLNHDQPSLLMENEGNKFVVTKTINNDIHTVLNKHKNYIENLFE